MASRKFGACHFDPSDGSLTGPATDRAQTLRPQVARLLEAFVDRPGQVLDREWLYRVVWDENTVVDFEAGLSALIRELRQALTKASGGSEMIETVPRRGYRLLVEIEPELADGRFSRRWPGPAFAWSALAVSLTLVFVLSLTMVNGFSIKDETTYGATAQPRLAIIPFEVYGPSNLDEPAARRLQLLMADSLLAQLWQAELPGLVLIGRAALRPYETRQDLAAAVAEDLGVELLLEGSLVFDEEAGWRIDARLLQMPEGSVLWSGQTEWIGGANRSLGEPAERLVEQLSQAWPNLFASYERSEVSR